jgi:type II secretory pathway component PulM
MATATAAPRIPPTLTRWWAGKSTAERRIVVALALLIVIVAAWFALWQPLTRDLASLRAAAPADRAARVSAQKTADELAGLARNAPARAAPDGRAELERVLQERGLRGAVTQLDWQDNRARLTFTNVRFDALIGALEALQRDAQLRTIEATLNVRVDPGTVRAELVLGR